MIYHPLYGMNNYVLIWGDWLSCDPLRGTHDSQSPPWGSHEPITPSEETLVPHLVATLIYLSQMYSYYIRGDRSPLRVIQGTGRQRQTTVTVHLSSNSYCWSPLYYNTAAQWYQSDQKGLRKPLFPITWHNFFHYFFNFAFEKLPNRPKRAVGPT